MPVRDDSIFPPGVVALLAGISSFIVMWVAFPKPVRVYVLGHELTHAAWGLLFGARVSDLRVREHGGSVRLSKSNVLITLAPYFFPFYTIVVVLAALAVRLCLGRLPCPWAWMFLVGLTWCFHCCFTVQSLVQHQPDIVEYGRIFSWTVILMINVVGVIAWITVTAPLPVGASCASVARRVSSAYGTAYSLSRAGFARAASAINGA